MSHILLTSESVGRGHPDKICDQIADYILDACLAQDPNSRVACEVLASNHLIVVGGEITTTGYVDVVQLAWKVLKPLGYDENDFTILNNINHQSIDIAHLVNKSNHTLGAGDQGMVYGYATNESPTYMPWAHVLATQLVQRATELIDNKTFKDAKYDMKSQVTLGYNDQGKLCVNHMIMSIQHSANANLNKFRTFVIKNIMEYIAKANNFNLDFTKHVNAGGNFIVGGPIGDTGLTGRKLMVDTYGSIAHHGGGAFSGKDYTKVDRTGAYFARWIAKNVVAAELADRCEIQLAFAIGVSKPIAMHVETFGTNHCDPRSIEQAINHCFDMELIKIVDQLKLKKTQYHEYSVFGHFGRRNVIATWEQTDKVKSLRDYLKLPLLK